VEGNENFSLQSENSAPIRREQLPMLAQRHWAKAKLFQKKKKTYEKFSSYESDAIEVTS